MLTLQTLTWDAILGRLRAGLKGFDTLVHSATVPPAAAAQRKCRSCLWRLAVDRIQLYSRHRSKQQLKVKVKCFFLFRNVHGEIFYNVNA